MPIVSPSILNNRIKDLREADIVERSLEGYQLTKRGKDLREILVQIGKWSINWADELFDYQKEVCNDKKNI